MAAVQRKLVHKQFNSPMGLYSQDNVKATLNRELKAFGAEGIEIDDQIAKPLNLANSAVLRAVEEEEQQQIKCGYKRVAWPPASEERIVREFTPQPQGQSPAPGSGGYYPQSAAPAPAATQAAPAQGPIYNNVQPQSHPTKYASNGHTSAPTQSQVPASYPSEQPIQYTQAQFNRQQTRDPVQAPPTQAPYPHQQQQQQQQQQQPQYPPTTYQQQQEQPHHAVDNAGGGWKHIRAPLPKTQHQFTPAGAAYTPYQQQQPTQSYLQQPSQQQQPQYRATSYDNNQQQQQVASAPQWQQQQPQWTQQQPHQSSPYQQQYQQPQQQPPQPQYPHQNGGSNYAQPQYNSYSQPQQQQQQQQLPYSQDQTDLQQQQHAAFAAQNSYRGASPGIITLRKETPVTQQPAPVYTSQPAAVSYRGGSKLRGDLKWPPPEYKEAAARENEERRQLALGPVCRPRKVNRDYTSFFARNQLNNGYPSYKVPPGTQHMFA